jgi:hypothetical protein
VGLPLDEVADAVLGVTASGEVRPVVVPEVVLGPRPLPMV